MTNSPLQDAQQVVCAGLLRENIEVVFDATTPAADLKNRVMHLRPLPEEIAPDDLRHLRADCDHELGHFWLTDADVFYGIERPLVRLLANAIEDGFVERAVSARWIGCAENLDWSRQEILRRITGDAQTRAVSGVYLLALGNSVESVLDVIGHDASDYLARLSDLIPAIRSVSRTVQSAELAAEIANRWLLPEPDPNPDPEQGAEPAPGRPEEESRTLPSADEEKVIADRLSAGLVANLRKEQISSDGVVETGYRAFTDCDTVEVLPAAVPSEYIVGFMDSVKRVVPPLRRRLVMEFKSQGVRTRHDQKSGCLDDRSLHKVALKNDRVFCGELPEIVVDADVSLLIDVSASMLHSHGKSAITPLYVAAQAAAAFSMVLDLVSVQNECLAFTTSQFHGVRPGVALKPEGQFDRVRSLRHIIVKPVASTFRACRGAFLQLANFGSCAENVDGESLLWAARRLEARRRPGRKAVLIVFSDGSPVSIPEHQHVLAAHMKRAVERVVEAGITTLGVGIMSRDVERFYPDYVVIDTVSDLVGACYGVIQRVLRSAKRRRR
jgi:hypothetical protein